MGSGRWTDRVQGLLSCNWAWLVERYRFIVMTTRAAGPHRLPCIRDFSRLRVAPLAVVGSWNMGKKGNIVLIGYPRTRNVSFIIFQRERRRVLFPCACS
jgi:hypothetical protein